MHASSIRSLLLLFLCTLLFMFLGLVDKKAQVSVPSSACDSFSHWAQAFYKTSRCYVQSLLDT